MYIISHLRNRQLLFPHFSSFFFFASSLADCFPLESEWQQVSSTLFRNLAGFNNAVFWMVSTDPPIFMSSTIKLLVNYLALEREACNQTNISEWMIIGKSVWLKTNQKKEKKNPENPKGTIIIQLHIYKWISFLLPWPMRSWYAFKEINQSNNLHLFIVSLNAFWE